MTSKLLRLSALLAAALPARCYLGHESAACVSDFRCQVQLSPDLSMRYKIILPDDYVFSNYGGELFEEECTGCKIAVQLTYEGYAWLGIGASPKGKMIGTRAVIGRPDYGPRMYSLDAKDPNFITPATDHNSYLEGRSIEFEDGQTVMKFTAPFASWGIPSRVGPSLNNLHTLVWAHGNAEAGELTYHGPAGKSSHTIANLMGFFDEVLDRDSISARLAGDPSRRSAWLAHGVMAFLAFGLMVPLSITTALLRDVDTEVMPDVCKYFVDKIKKRWLYIHVGLNAATYAFALIIFLIAVSTIQMEHNGHFYSIHAKMGLAIFLLATLQVIGGYFRPPNTLEKEESRDIGENGAANEDNEDSVGAVDNKATKSTLRQTWEILHLLVGLVLLLFGAWQMYEGIELYHERYFASLGAVIVEFLYIVWMGLVVLAIMVGAPYKWLYVREDGGSAEKAGVELAETERADDDVRELT